MTNWINASKVEDYPGWVNYFSMHGYGYAQVGLALLDDHPAGLQCLNEFRYNRFRNVDLPCLEHLAEGAAVIMQTYKAARQDRYERWLATVWLTTKTDGEADIASQMVALGLGKWTGPEGAGAR